MGFARQLVRTDVALRGYALKQQGCFKTSSRSYFDSIKQEFISKINLRSPKAFTSSYGKEAAVMVPLCISNGKPSILFTLRSSSLVRNKSDVSFPGGIKELGDESTIQIALRETEEEIGIKANDVHIWTEMQPFTSKRRQIWVTPVVAFLGDVNPQKFTVNSSEVETVFTETLESLCNESNWRSTQYRPGYTLPVFIGLNYRIWGMTSVILYRVLESLCPEFYKYELRVNKMKEMPKFN